MLKSIPQYNYTIRPFKAYKSWNFVSGSDVVLMNAQDTVIFYASNSIALPNGIIYNKHSLYGQISSFFYNDVDNPFFRIGKKSYTPASQSGERYLGTLAKVFSIPNKYVGDGIKPGSVSLTDSTSTISYVDNFSGSLMSGSSIVGDVFYNQGTIIYTASGSVVNAFTGSWNVSYKSTETIREHEILISVEKDEFNVSTNKSATVEVGAVREYFVDTDNVATLVDKVVGVKYVARKTTLKDGTVLDYRFQSRFNPLVSGGFEHGELSASVDSTGSFLAPMITTIGLFDDNYDMIAVAKLPQPIKNDPDMPINFIVRLDT